MTNLPPLATGLLIEPPSERPKLRRCLLCKAEFPSAWAGERLCSRCKNTAKWRNGVPSSRLGSGGRRSRLASS